MSTTISDALLNLRAELVAAGIPATTVPAKLPQLVAQEGAAAMVGAPDVRGLGLRGSITISVPVQVCGTTGDPDGMGPVWDLIPAVIRITRDGEIRSPSTYYDMPGYEFVAVRRVDCPTE